jgi:hypothetical protein
MPIACTPRRESLPNCPSSRVNPLRVCPHEIQGAAPISLQSRHESECKKDCSALSRGAHNANTSSIAAWNDGCLDTIASLMFLCARRFRT